MLLAVFLLISLNLLLGVAAGNGGGGGRKGLGAQGRIHPPPLFNSKGDSLNSKGDAKMATALLPWPGIPLKWKQQSVTEEAAKSDATRFVTLMHVDVAPIQEKLRKLGPSIWEKDVQAKTNAVLLAREANQEYFKPGVKGFHLFFSDRQGLNVYEYPWWQEWKDVLMPIFQQVFGKYYDITNERHFVRLQFANMKVGSAIKKHVDSGPWVQSLHRVHIPVFVNDKVEFRVLDKTGKLVPIPVKEGDVFEVNNAILHNVDNLGDADRVHLLIDFSESPITNDYFHVLSRGQSCKYNGQNAFNCNA